MENQQDEKPNFLSVDQVAQRLRLSRRTVNGYFTKYADELQPMKIGRLMYIDEKAYPLLLESLRVKPTKPTNEEK